MISSGFGPSLVEIKSLGIGLLETSNFDLDLDESEFLAVGETYRFDNDTRNSLYNLLVNRDGVGINTSRKQLDGYFNQSVKKNALYVGSDIICTGNIITNGFRFDNVNFDTVNSNVLELVLESLENKQNIFYKGDNTIRVGLSADTEVTNNSLNNYYTTNNITLGTDSDTYLNASPLNIATTADFNIDNTHITMTNKSSSLSETECYDNDPEITKFRLGIVGNSANSPAVVSTTSGMPLTFHVGLSTTQVNSLYASETQSIPVYTNTGLSPSMSIDTSGNVIIGGTSTKTVEYQKYSKDGEENISSKTVTANAKLSVEGVSAFEDIVVYDYYNDKYSHMDDIYVRNIGMTFTADQIKPGDFNAGIYRFTSNVVIGTHDSTSVLEVNNLIDVHGNVNVDNHTTTKQITVTDVALFNKNIQVEDTIVSSTCRTTDMQILGDLNIDNVRINIQNFHPIMVDEDIANASNINGSNILFFAYDNAINISNSNLAVPGKLSAGITRYDSVGGAQMGIFKTEYANIELMIKDASRRGEVAETEPAMYIGHLTSLPTNNGDVDNSVVFNTNQTEGLHNIYFYTGNDIINDSFGFRSAPTLTVHQNGKVGINNKDPKYELDVVGDILTNDIYIRTNASANKAMFFVSKKDEFSQEGDVTKDFFYLYDSFGSIDKYCINFTDIRNGEGLCGQDILLKGLNVKGGIHATTGGYYQHNKQVANFIIDNPNVGDTAFIDKNIVIGYDKNIATRVPVVVKNMCDDKYNDSIMRFHKGEKRGDIDPRFSGIDMCSSINHANPTKAYGHANSNRWFMYRDHRYDELQGEQYKLKGMLRFGHTSDNERPNNNSINPISIVAFENDNYTTHINRSILTADVPQLEELADKAMVVHGDMEVKGNINITGNYSINGNNVNISPNAIEDIVAGEEVIDSVVGNAQQNDVVITGDKVAILPEKTLAVGHNAGPFLKYLQKLGNSQYNVPLTVYQNQSSEPRVSKFMSLGKASIELCTLNLAQVGEGDSVDIEKKDSSVNFEVYKSSKSSGGIWDGSVFNITGHSEQLVHPKPLFSIYHSNSINYARFGDSLPSSSSIIENVALHVENSSKHLMYLNNTSSYSPAITMQGNRNSFWTIEAPNKNDEFILKFDKNVEGNGLTENNAKKVFVLTSNRLGINVDCPIYSFDVLGEADRSCMRITNEYSEKSITDKYSKMEISNFNLQHDKTGLHSSDTTDGIKIISEGFKYYVENKDFPIRDINGKRILQDFLDIENLVAIQSSDITEDLTVTVNIDGDDVDIAYQYTTKIQTPTTISDQTRVEITAVGICEPEFNKIIINNVTKFVKPVPDGLYAGDGFKCDIQTITRHTFNFDKTIGDTAYTIEINDNYEIYDFTQEQTFYLEINTIEYQPHIVLQNNIHFDTVHSSGEEVRNGKINKIFSKDGAFEITTEDEIVKKSILRIDETGDTFISGGLDVKHGNITTNTIFMNDIYIKGDVYDKMGNSMTYNYSENMFDRAFVMQSSNYILYTSNYSIHTLSNLDFVLQKECNTGLNIIKEYEDYDIHHDLFKITEIDKGNNDNEDLAFIVTKGGRVGIQRIPDCCFDLDVKLSTRSPYINSHEIVSDTIEADGSNLRNVNLSDRNTSMLKEGSNLYFTSWRVGEILDASNAETCNYIRKLDTGMSNYVDALTLDQITIGEINTFIVDNAITNTNTSNELTILGNLYVTGSVTIIGSNKVLTTSDQSNTSLNISGFTEEPSLNIHRSNNLNDILLISSQYGDDEYNNIFNIDSNGIIRVNKPIGDDETYQFDVEGALRATNLHGDGANITNVNLSDRNTSMLEEEGSNLYFTSWRVGEILDASNVETCNYIRKLDTNMSNYLGGASNDISIRIANLDTNMSNYLDGTSNDISIRIANLDTNMSNYLDGTSNDISIRIANLDTNMSNYLDGTSNDISIRIANLDTNMSNYLDGTSNDISIRIANLDNNMSNYLDGASNDISIRIANLDNNMSNYLDSTSNDISIAVDNVLNSLEYVIRETTNTTYAKYMFESDANAWTDSSVNKRDLIPNNEGPAEVSVNTLVLGSTVRSVKIPTGTFDDYNIVKIKFDFKFIHGHDKKIFKIEYTTDGVNTYNIVLYGPGFSPSDATNDIYIPNTNVIPENINKFEMSLFRNNIYEDEQTIETFDTLIYLNNSIVRLGEIPIPETTTSIDHDVTLDQGISIQYGDDTWSIGDFNTDDGKLIILDSSVSSDPPNPTKFTIIFEEATYTKGVKLTKVKLTYDGIVGASLEMKLDNVEMTHSHDDGEKVIIFDTGNTVYKHSYEIEYSSSTASLTLVIITLIFEAKTFEITLGDNNMVEANLIYISNVEISVQDTITLRETTMLCRDTFAENIKNCGIDQIKSSQSNLVVYDNITSSNINTISLYSDSANISNLIVHENITSSNINTNSLYSDIANISNLVVHENIKTSNINTISLYSDIANISNLVVHENIETPNINTISLYSDSANISNLIVHENITSSNINTNSLYSDIANISNLVVHENIKTSNINTNSLYSDIANISNLVVHENIKTPNINTISLNAESINVSNLYVKGATTTIETDSYKTHNLVIMEDSLFYNESEPGIEIRTEQHDALVVKNDQDDVFKIDKDGKIYNRDHGFEIDIITCTSNYITDTSDILNEKFTYANVLHYEPDVVLTVDGMKTIFNDTFKFQNNCLNITYNFEIQDKSSTEPSMFNIGIIYFNINNQLYTLRLEIKNPELVFENTMNLLMYNLDYQDELDSGFGGYQKINTNIIYRDVNIVNMSIFHNGLNKEVNINEFTILLYINEQYIPIDIDDFEASYISSEPRTNIDNDSIQIKIYSADKLSQGTDLSDLTVRYYKKISNFRVREIKQQYPVITESVLINNTSNLNPKPFILTSNNSEVFSIGADGRIFVQGSEYKPSEFKKSDNDIYYEKGRFHVSEYPTTPSDDIDYLIFTDKHIVCSNLYIKSDDEDNYIHLRSSNQNSFEVFNSSGDTIFEVNRYTNQVSVGGELLSEFEKKESSNIYYRKGKFGVSSNQGGDFEFPDYNELSLDRDYAFYSYGDIYCDGTIMATGDVIASYSDIRLKTKLSEIYNPIEKIMQIETFQYMASPLAQSLGINDKNPQIGVSAQSVQKILPEIIHLAPFDTKIMENGDVISKSGSNFLTVSYERLVPLLIECIKQQQVDIDMLKTKLM